VDAGVHREFAAAVAGRDVDVDLYGGAMAIARIGHPSLDIHHYSALLDRLAEEVSDVTGDTLDPEALAHGIDHVLFAVRGFRGNEADYADPQNSYLNVVIDRRAGIPITLSLVYMEVAARVGLRCEGVGYPGHFIVRCGRPEDGFFVDPFHQGDRLDRGELLARLRSVELAGASPESLLLAITRRQVLQRMLNNLRRAFRSRQEIAQWLTAVELQLILEPWNAPLTGERGMLNFRLGRYEEAERDLERYVQSSGREAAHSGASRMLDRIRTQQRRGEEV
jgi:regulator of sirC expression with transglutaminase-like and TPR domain